MRKIYLCLITLVLFNVTNAQWQWQNPKPLGLNLQAVHAFSTTEMVATAAGNVAIRTTDGGATWSYTYPHTSFNTYNDLNFVGTTGWLVGGGGAIMKSVDKGQNWNDQSTLASEYWRGVAAITTTFAVTVGHNGKIARTTNGATWSLCNITGAVKNYIAVSFRGTDINTGEGLAVGENGALARTTDGGQNWTVLTSMTTSTLNGVFYQSGTSNAWVVGHNGEIWKTTDDGTSWTQLTSPVGTNIFNDIQIVGGRGYIVGASGRILRSIDGGDTWSLYTTDPNGSSLNGLSMISLNQGWIVGQGGKVLLNSDGTSFNVISVGYSPFTNFNGVDFADLNKGVACGTAGVIKYTSDGGTTWSFATSSGLTPQLNSVAFSDLSHVSAVGNSGTIIRSTDAGNNWISQTVGADDLNGIAFGSATIGVAVGNNGVVLKTINSGAAWAAKTSGTTENLKAVSFSDVNKAIAVGNNGTILSSSDGGETWSLKTSGTTENLLAVHFIKNKSIAFVAGANGTLLRSVDNGNSWSVVPNTAANVGTGDYVAVQGGDENNVALVTASSVYHTSDFGTTWANEATTLAGISGFLKGLKAVNGSNLWAVGDASTILKSQAGLVILPITLSSFSAHSQNKKVLLNWTTSMELNNTGFAVMRKTSTGNHDWEEVGFVRSSGNSNTTQSYSFTDEPKGGETFLYQLKQIDTDGKSTLSNILKVKIDVSEISLSNYPNPFRGQTTINYSLPKTTQVRLVIRNQFGQIVKTVVNAKQTAGNYVITVNANDLSSGIYYSELYTGSEKLFSKLSLQK